MHSSFENTTYKDHYSHFLEKNWKIMQIFFKNVYIL